ncbi:hypothetical protein [Cryobacterium sp. TMS1-13-1]|uniref:hypothetical protein n=1 Tax=Cryobacterium sp. TMS1-13-1 TaxID=1259220 RepID=UPI00141BD08F|nr:hypothetical protein [Cryobacterium sp. TMS1-13-1]
MSNALSVFLHEDYLGVVETYRSGRQHDKHRIIFTWDSDYRPGLITLTESFASLPGTRPDATLVSNFFGGYAPDGNQRDLVPIGTSLTVEPTRRTSSNRNCNPGPARGNLQRVL